MEIPEMIQRWIADNPGVVSLIKYLFALLIIVIIVSLIRRAVKRRFPDTASKYKLQKGVEVAGYSVAAILSIVYFAGGVSDVGLLLGLFTAGLTFTLQELVLSIAGSLYIFVVGVYKPGDRIEINGIKGDVLDIDSVYTVLMEIGEWVTSDNYTGRIVRLSNAFVFRGPVYNYSQDFPFVWDELTVPIRYGSEMDVAKEIVTTVAAETLSEYVHQSRETWARVVERYYIEDAVLEPTLAITLTDNWIELNLRYIVSYKKRRSIRDQLFEGIRRRVTAAEGQVALASATFEVVRFPELRVAPGERLPTAKRV